jgi:hypothetical protein
MKLINPVSNAGLEHSVYQENLPYVIKGPGIIKEICNYWPDTLSIDRAIIPIRNLHHATQSRILVTHKAKELGEYSYGYPGALTGVEDEEFQYLSLCPHFYLTIWTLLAYDVPIIFIKYPDMILDKYYFCHALNDAWQNNPMNKVFSDEEIYNVHDKIANKELIGVY